MVYKDISDAFFLILSDKITRTFAIFITITSFFTALTFSTLFGGIIFGCYLLGFLISWTLIRYKNHANVYLQRLASFYQERHYKKLTYSCSVCDNLSCRRHHENQNLVPWKNIYVEKDLNDALESFYNHILDEFVASWYQEFSGDGEFLRELKYCLRFSSASLISRILKVNPGNVIANRLLPYAVKHIDDYLYMQQISKLHNVRFNDVVIEFLGKRLHVAATSRKNELSYLQHLTDVLLPRVLPAKYLQCRNYTVLIKEILSGWVLLPLMDVLSDPNILNLLVHLAVTYKSQHHSSSTENVEFLKNFGYIKKEKQSLFFADLNTVKQEVDLLYNFMQFLKKEDHVHLLMFCLHVDEFNNKLLTPELSKKQLEELHSEATKLYKEYLKSDSFNFIGCSKDISDGFYYLIKDGVHTVARLRTSKPLYQAYEHAFSVLENEWLPQFFHSSEFYGYLCGFKASANSSKVSGNRKKLDPQGQSAVLRLSSGLGKLKGALRANQPIDGAIFPLENENLENGAIEDIILPERVTLFRDLSSWRVSITAYESVNKIVHFHVNVQRLDSINEQTKNNWIVLRKDQDFYTLKAKLVEFHGENEICDSPLPARKAGSTIETRMSKYEDFLKKLLQKQALRGSDLVHTFLTIEEDFTMFISTSAAAIQDLGNIYQFVALKLRKEKGQHLDSFMNTFLTSVGKNQHGKFEWAEIGDEMDPNVSLKIKTTVPMPKTYRSFIFNDNFGVSYGALKDLPGSSFNPVGVTECLFYLFKTIFKIPSSLLRLYTALCGVSSQAIESLIKLFINRKLKSALCHSNLAILVRNLEEVIFKQHVPTTKEELEERKRRAFAEIKTICPNLLIKLLGNDINNGLETILNILQHPHYNKHLFYHFLDIILLEVYPDLAEAESQKV